MNKKVLTVIPFFNSAIHYGDHTLDISLETFINCLYHTYESVKNISDQIVIAFTNKDVMQEIRSKNLNKVSPMYFSNITTDLLPSSLCATLLQHDFPHDYVLYTEADQIIDVSFENLEYILNVIDKDDNVYVSPHRIEQTPNSKIRNIRRHYSDAIDTFYSEMRPHSIDDSSWFCLHGKPNKNKNYDEKFYINKTIEEAYSGSYICSSNFFKNITFTFNKENSTKYASGWDAFNKENSISLKPINTDFFSSYKLSSWQYNKLSF